MSVVNKIFADITAGWSWHQRPLAIHYKGLHDKTYIAWVDASDGFWIGSYNHTTGAFEKTKLKTATWASDDHNSPAILIRDSDKRIIVFYVGHGSSTIWWKISTNAEDITSFGVEKSLINPTASYSYVQPIELTKENKVYLFTRCSHESIAGQRVWDINISVDDGETFARHISPLWYSTDTNAPYPEVVSNGIDTIWFSRSDWLAGQPSYIREHLMFIKYKGGKFYKADGTEVCTWNDLPITDKYQLDLIYDTRIAENDYCFGKDIAVDFATGDIAIAFTTLDSSMINHHWYARWDNSLKLWNYNYIVMAGGNITEVTTQPAYEAGLVLNHENINEVYLGREIPLGSKHFEIERWYTHDKGITWIKIEDITAPYPMLDAKQFRPYVPINHHPQMRVLWIGASRYTNYDSYDSYLYALQGHNGVMCKCKSNKGIEKLKLTNDNSQLKIYTEDGLKMFSLVPKNSPSIVVNTNSGLKSIEKIQ